MDAFFDLPWRHGPAIALILLGISQTFRGLRSMPSPTGPKVDLMAWLRGFRRAVIGLTLALVGLAWLCQLPWLLAIALGVGLQETRESTHFITTLQTFTPRWKPHASQGVSGRAPSPMGGDGAAVAGHDAAAVNWRERSLLMSTRIR